MTRPTSETTWADDVVDASTPVLVDFWAPWCNPCRMLEPVLAEIASAHRESLAVLTVDVDENPQLAAEHGVASLPTLKVFRGGVAELTLVGPRSRNDLEAELAPYIDQH